MAVRPPAPALAPALQRLLDLLAKDRCVVYAGLGANALSNAHDTYSVTHCLPLKSGIQKHLPAIGP